MTIQHLKRITLESQGLLKASSFGKGKKAVLKALEHLGYLQIDSLSIVERAHHHTLWTRVPDYKQSYLDDLVKEGKIFEYWFHAASYLPMNDFRYALPKMLRVKHNKSHYYNADPKVMQYVLDKIRIDGPKKARDFESESKKAGSWWNWKPTKLALERLFMQGDLMICERSGIQKTYDLTERVLPENLNLTEPNPHEYAEYLVKTYLKAYGFTTIKQITHLKKGQAIRDNVNQVLDAMLYEGIVQKMDLEGMPTVFVLSEFVDKSIRANKSTIHILSPFDNSIIHRDRISQLFDFDYSLECYLPKQKRQYGYFCLPILFGDKFIGRVDCKAHRKEKLFEIINLHIESKSINIESMIIPFVDSIKKFAAFNGCDSIKLSNVNPKKFTDEFEKLFNNSK
ncbi:winged helix-turn-helix domain-containing protein [Marinigracilibium pacificum]|uniref:winged helix-turn-helix domain-containing protein n=1 Tax=Marinigracilibium pacificum TaxID=2729599 RepID=UPI00232A259D|nr:crosslink repair DNA glycosylase YcaQ family protein [Marinigracilibium pacificum]